MTIPAFFCRHIASVKFQRYVQWDAQAFDNDVAILRHKLVNPPLEQNETLALLLSRLLKILVGGGLILGVIFFWILQEFQPNRRRIQKSKEKDFLQ